MAEFRIDAGVVLTVASVLFLNLVNKGRILNNKEVIVCQAKLIERMALQHFIVGVADFVLKQGLKLQEGNRASGSNGRVREVCTE